jgi:hypothetical protein
MADNVHYVSQDWEEKNIIAPFALTQKGGNENYSSSRHTDSGQMIMEKTVTIHPLISYDQ